MDLKRWKDVSPIASLGRDSRWEALHGNGQKPLGSKRFKLDDLTPLKGRSHLQLGRPKSSLSRPSVAFRLSSIAQRRTGVGGADVQ